MGQSSIRKGKWYAHAIQGIKPSEAPLRDLGGNSWQWEQQQVYQWVPWKVCTK